MAFLEKFNVLSQLAAFESPDKIKWLIKVRWIAILVQIVCLIFAEKFHFLNEKNLYWLSLLIAVEIAFNFISHLLMGKSWKPKLHTLQFHLVMDVVFLTALLSLSGACMNPFYGIFYFHAALGAILIREWLASISFVLVLSVCIAWTCHLTPHEWVMAGGVPHNIRIAAEVLIAMLIWLFCHWLSAINESSQRKISALKEYKSRIDHLRLLGVASANLSHEIASPLNAIEIQLDRLIRLSSGLMPSEEFLDIKAAVKACKKKLQIFIHAEDEGSAGQIKPTDIQDFIKDICLRWQGANISRSPVFSLEDLESGSRWVYPIPRFSFARAILDVLDNARDASKDDIHIDIRMEETESGNLNVSFMDRGHGFAQQVLKNIGKPFNSKKFNGSGLGLYNCSLFASSIGGEFKVTNTGSGSKVEFLIPRLV